MPLNLKHNARRYSNIICGKWNEEKLITEMCLWSWELGCYQTQKRRHTKGQTELWVETSDLGSSSPQAYWDLNSDSAWFWQKDIIFPSVIKSWLEELWATRRKKQYKEFEVNDFLPFLWMSCVILWTKKTQHLIWWCKMHIICLQVLMMHFKKELKMMILIGHFQLGAFYVSISDLFIFFTLNDGHINLF